MAITDDLPKFERMLNELIAKYEQYFIGLEKREPLPLLNEVDQLVRRYCNTNISNTMFKHKFAMLVARLNTYREHWNRTVKRIEEGKYKRNRLADELHPRQADLTPQAALTIRDLELDRIYNELLDACKTCNLPVDKFSRDTVTATLEKKMPDLVSRLENGEVTVQIVVENGKPKIKTSQRQ
jgi:hypothetical protein